MIYLAAKERAGSKSVLLTHPLPFMLSMQQKSNYEMLYLTPATHTEQRSGLSLSGNNSSVSLKA